MRHILINYAVFQLGWFACVWGAASGRPWLGPIVVGCAVGVHLLLARRPSREAILMVVCALCGMVFDSALLWTGWVAYPNGNWIPGLAPYWIIALWVVFGSTLNLSMGWLRGRPWLALLFGAVGGPASYLAGQGLGAMSLIQPVPALIALGVGWGLALPTLCRLAVRFDGITLPPHPHYVQPNWRNAGVSSHV